MEREHMVQKSGAAGAHSEPGFIVGNGVHAPSSFATVLRQERSRVQRFGGGFSLLLIALPARAEETAWLGTFIASVHRRLRAMDALGWVDRETLGVVLPVTSLDGAWTVARDLERIAKGTGIPLRCTVSRYPESPDSEAKKPVATKTSSRPTRTAGKPDRDRKG